MKNTVAALGHRQIPLKLLGLRLGLPFISSLSFILFLGFGALFFFFPLPETKRKDRPDKRVCYRRLGSSGLWRSALLKTSFRFNGVELVDLDQSCIYVELAEVFWLHAMPSAHLQGKLPGVSFRLFVCAVCLCSSQKKLRTGDVPPAKP